MPQKLRLSLEERIRAVEECLNGKESVVGCSKKIMDGKEFDFVRQDDDFKNIGC